MEMLIILLSFVLLICLFFAFFDDATFPSIEANSTRIDFKTAAPTPKPALTEKPMFKQTHELLKPDITLPDTQPFINKWTDVGTSTKQASDAELKSMVDDVYDAFDIERPIHIHVFDSPSAAMQCQFADNAAIDSNTFYDNVFGSLQVSGIYKDDYGFGVDIDTDSISRDGDKYKLNITGLHGTRTRHVTLSLDEANALLLDLEIQKNDALKLPAEATCLLGVSEFNVRGVRDGYRHNDGMPFSHEFAARRQGRVLHRLADLDYRAKAHEKESVMQNMQVLRIALNHCSELIIGSEYAYVARNPTEINLSSDGALHSENGAAVKYADGTSYYFINGVDIPGEWVEGTAPDVSEVLTWENIDKRTAVCGLIGWDKVLESVNSETLDKHEDAQMGELLLVNMPNTGPELFIKAECGTGRTVAMCVTESRARTVQQAQDWVWQMPDGIHYNPESRT